MNLMKACCVLLFVILNSNLSAAEKEKVAVVEFKNRSESAMRFNGTDLAARMCTELKKHDRFEPVDRKAVQKIVKNADWSDERLNQQTELQLREIPAQYALYGSLTDWKSSFGTITGGEITRRDTSRSANGVYVAFYFELVDLTKGKSIKTFRTTGEGLSAPGPPPMQGTASAEQAQFDVLFEEASKSALRQAAIILSEKQSEESDTEESDSE
ncbi:MAG TPA: CsgG/HfaB family protein [Acidobacteriota bacterium]|nr:CsgG/HfaB family protein [Acidobacteriota bacterium]